MALLLALLIGFCAGLRSFTAPAATAWAAHLGWLELPGAVAFMGSTGPVAAWTLLAVAELLADKWPRIPDRTTGPGLIARILTGGLAGTCMAAAGGASAVLGAIFGSFGGAAGCFGGYHARKRLARVARAPDYAVAVLEDAVAVGGAAWVVTRLV